MSDAPATLPGAKHLPVLRQILQAELGVQPDDVQPHHRLEIDLVCDELDAMVIALEIEDRFGIAITDDEATALMGQTVAEVLALIAAKQAVRA